jgi:hypothetical protein
MYKFANLSIEAGNREEGFLSTDWVIAIALYNLTNFTIKMKPSISPPI